MSAYAKLLPLARLATTRANHFLPYLSLFSFTPYSLLQCSHQQQFPSALCDMFIFFHCINKFVKVHWLFEGSSGLQQLFEPFVHDLGLLWPTSQNAYLGKFNKYRILRYALISQLANIEKNRKLILPRLTKCSNKNTTWN